MCNTHHFINLYVKVKNFCVECQQPVLFPVLECHEIVSWNTTTISTDFSFQFLGKLLLIQGEVLFENSKVFDLNSSKENYLHHADGAEFQICEAELWDRRTSFVVRLDVWCLGIQFRLKQVLRDKH